MNLRPFKFSLLDQYYSSKIIHTWKSTSANERRQILAQMLDGCCFCQDKRCQLIVSGGGSLFRLFFFISADYIFIQVFLHWYPHLFDNLKIIRNENYFHHYLIYKKAKTFKLNDSNRFPTSFNLINKYKKNYSLLCNDLFFVETFILLFKDKLLYLFSNDLFTTIIQLMQ